MVVTVIGKNCNNLFNLITTLQWVLNNFRLIFTYLYYK